MVNLTYLIKAQRSGHTIAIPSFSLYIYHASIQKRIFLFFLQQKCTFLLFKAFNFYHIFKKIERI
jgi:hypothetical protein